MLPALILAAFQPVGPAGAQSGDPAVIKIGYMRPSEPPRMPLSLIDRPADDDGIAGARLAIADNNTTGRFLKQNYELIETSVSNERQVADAVDRLNADGVGFIVADLPAELLLAAADRAAEHGIWILNASATDDSLRMEDCRANVIHVAPSRAMLADALAQYLVWKKWSRWFLIVGSHQADELYAQAIKRAAHRFGARIVDERVFKDTGGARTTESGSVQVQRQMPVFTQGAPEHDVIIAADESEVFGAYLPYRTWVARPVAGTAGLTPKSWSPAHVQWAGIQLNNRFTRNLRRQMTEKDVQAWTAVRMLGEAATRTNSADPEKMMTFIKGPDFEVAAFKGQPLTLRDWNLQLRQPILLSDSKTVVSVSPQEGFLHQRTELDTLGYDQPETKCKL